MTGKRGDREMNAKRGYVPDDDRNFSTESLELLKTASRHVLFLINEGYDLKQSITFVGNHYLLSERQRLAIMRSVATKEQLEKRKKSQLLIHQLSDRTVWIDGFNTIITLEVMLSDSILFSCMDGAIRDLASLRGTYRIIDVTEPAVRLALNTLEEAGVSAVKILLDQPVSNSGRLKALITDVSQENHLMTDVIIQKDVDRLLYQKENVITSDSVILDHCTSWFNLAEVCLGKLKKASLKVW